MSDEIRMEKSKNNKSAIEWAGITYNPMLPHQIKKFVDERRGPRGAKRALLEHLKTVEPGQGLTAGPFDMETAKAAVKSAQNIMVKMKWKEGYNIGVYQEDGSTWLAIVRGLKTRTPGSRDIIME